MRQRLSDPAMYIIKPAEGFCAIRALVSQVVSPSLSSAVQSHAQLRTTLRTNKTVHVQETKHRSSSSPRKVSPFHPSNHIQPIFSNSPLPYSAPQKYSLHDSESSDQTSPPKYRSISSDADASAPQRLPTPSQHQYRHQHYSY